MLSNLLGNDFDLEKIIKDTIKSTLMNRLSLSKRVMLRRIMYFPSYTTCDVTNEKSISSIYLKVKGNTCYEKMSIREIELTGASIIEFIDYLNEYGAIEITDCKKLLDIV